MNEVPLQSFIDLINFDQGIHTIQEKVEQIAHETELLQQEEACLTQQLKSVRQRTAELRKEVDIKERAMKELDQSEAEKKSKLELVGGYKEYQSIKAEISSLKQAQHDYEEVLIAAWNTAENAEKEYEEQKNLYDQQVKKIYELIEEKNKTKVELESQLQERSQQRLEKEKLVPAEWLEKYVIMRNHVHNPVVPVMNNSCSACFYLITEQDLNLLRRRKLLQCKDCYRFLYLPS